MTLHAVHASPSHGYVCFLYSGNDFLVIELSPYFRNKIRLIFQAMDLVLHCWLHWQHQYSLQSRTSTELLWNPCPAFELSFVSSKTALSSKTPTSGTLYMKIYNCLYTRLPLSKFIIAENESCSLLLAI